MGPAQLTVDRLGLFGLQAHGISLYGGSVRAAELTMAYDPFRLAAGVVNQVELSGLHVAIAIAGKDILIAGAPLHLAASPSGTSAGWRVGALKINDADLTIDRPGGRIEGKFSTDLALSGSDISNASLHRGSLGAGCRRGAHVACRRAESGVVDTRGRRNAAGVSQRGGPVQGHALDSG